jgi:hypothetical protein
MVDSKPRLSPLIDSNEAGTNALNLYHLLSQILDIYAIAENLSHKEETDALWKSFSKSLLSNIGEVYEFWSYVKQESDYGLAEVESRKIRMMISHLSLRTSKIQSAIHDWTSIAKMPKILIYCEDQWQKICLSFNEENGNYLKHMNHQMGESRGRVRTLEKLLQYYENEKKRYELVLGDEEIDLV